MYLVFISGKRVGQYKSIAKAAKQVRAARSRAMPAYFRQLRSSDKHLTEHASAAAMTSCPPRL